MVRLVQHHTAKLLRLPPLDEATYLDGINALARYLLDSLNVGEFGDPIPDDILADAMEFCHRHCSAGEEPGANGEPPGPGRGLRCATCTLKRHTLDLHEDTLRAITREAVSTEEAP